jgi:hypothetical protein
MMFTRFDWIMLTICIVLFIVTVAVGAATGYFLGTLPSRPIEIYIHFDTGNK